MFSGMDHLDDAFPNLPGWRFSLKEISCGVWQAEGHHTDGRSVSRMGLDDTQLIRECGEDAKNLPEGRNAPRS